MCTLFVYIIAHSATPTKMPLGAEPLPSRPLSYATVHKHVFVAEIINVKKYIPFANMDLYMIPAKSIFKQQVASSWTNRNKKINLGQYKEKKTSKRNFRLEKLVHR